jgi:hypothetical protein
MRKIFLILAVLMVTSPAWADIDIICVPAAGQVDTVEVDVRYVSTELNKPRAFAFDITVDSGAVIAGVVPGSVDPNFSIHPGTFGLDEGGNPVGDVISPPEYPGTQPGTGTDGVTTEQASLYIGEVNAPGQSGTLFTLIIDGFINDCNLTIAPNVIRAGDNGVVMEDPAEAVTVNYPAPCLITSDCWCLGDGTENELPPGPYGKNGRVNIFDLQTMALLLQPTSPSFSIPTPAGLECLDIVNTGTLLPAAIDGPDGTIDIFDLQNIALWLQPTSPSFDQPCVPLGATEVPAP